MMTVGERIKLAREAKGLSQTELANALKIKKQNLYKYENNIITNIPSDKIEAIAEKLNVSPGYLMGWEKQIYKTNYTLTAHEADVISAYRQKPDMQPAVDKLLGIETDTIPSITAARSKNNDEPIRIENVPDLSKFEPDDSDL